MFEYLSFFWSLILIVFLSILLIKDFSNYSKRKGFIISGVLIIHLISTYYFYFTALEVNKDSLRFFSNPDNLTFIDLLENFNLMKLAKSTMTFLAIILKKIGFNFLSITLLSSIVGFLGFRKFILETDFQKIDTILKKSIFYFLMFCPSFHYWTSGFSKEAFVFFLLSHLFFLKIKFAKHYIQLIFLILLIGLFRFYIALFIIIAMIIYIKQKHFSKKPIYDLIILMGVIFFSILSFEMFNLEEIIINFQNLKNKSDWNGTTTYPINQTNIIQRGIIVLFRPIFFDANNLKSLILSFENIFMLTIFCYICYLFIFSKIYFKKTYQLTVALVLFVFSFLFHSTYMYNLGLASRMKIHFLPFILYVLSIGYETKTD